MRDDDRLVIHLDPDLLDGLDQAARAAGQTREQLIRQTLAARVAKPRKKPTASRKPKKAVANSTSKTRKSTKKPESAYDVLVRMGLHRWRPSKKLPRDLSTNPKYMEGFGL